MTTLDGIECIWERHPAGTSNSLKAAVYAERAKVVLQRVLDMGAAHPALRDGSVSRRHVAKLVGCSYATLTQNVVIRGLLDATDKRLAAGLLPPGASELQLKLDALFEPAAPQSVLRVNSLFSRIVLTEKDFRSAGDSLTGVPTIVFADGIHEASGDWLRHLVVYDSVQFSSAYQYAKILRPYLAFCRRRQRPWESADDEWLLEWKTHLLNVRHVQEPQVNYSLGVVFQFYVYCEESGTLRYRVGCHERSLLPTKLQQVAFPLTAVRTLSGQEHKVLSWTTPLLYRNVDSSIGNRATPTTNELESAHRQALKGRNGSRDTLLMSLAEDTGGRRSEILQLKFSEIPDLDAVDALADRPDAWWPIQVIRKGRRKGVLHLQPDTLYAIHGYLRVRAAVVKASREKWHDYVEPSELFLSSTTGAALKPDSVTALVGNYFRRIGLKLVNVHRIRARFAVDAVETTLDAFLELGIEFAPDSNWIETVLQQVATRMGHKNPSSLRHYLTVALERRIRVSYASAERLKLKRDRNSQLATEAALARAKFTSRLLADMDAYAGPLKRAAALRKHAAELEAQAAG